MSEWGQDGRECIEHLRDAGRFKAQGARRGLRVQFNAACVRSLRPRTNGGPTFLTRGRPGWNRTLGPRPTSGLTSPSRSTATSFLPQGSSGPARPEPASTEDRQLDVAGPVIGTARLTMPCVASQRSRPSCSAPRSSTARSPVRGSSPCWRPTSIRPVEDRGIHRVDIGMLGRG